MVPGIIYHGLPIEEVTPLAIVRGVADSIVQQVSASPATDIPLLPLPPTAPVNVCPFGQQSWVRTRIGITS